MANTIELSEEKWLEIYNQLAREFPPSYLLIRSVQKEQLGFTVRRHRAYDDRGGDGWGEWKESIMLDFYNDTMEVWFRMKYL